MGQERTFTPADVWLNLSLLLTNKDGELVKIPVKYNGKSGMPFYESSKIGAFLIENKDTILTLEGTVQVTNESPNKMETLKPVTLKQEKKSEEIKTEENELDF